MRSTNLKNSTMIRKTAQNIYKAIVDNDLYNAPISSIDMIKGCNKKLQDIITELLQNNDFAKFFKHAEREELQEGINQLSKLDFIKDYLHSVSILKLYGKITADKLFDISQWIND